MMEVNETIMAESIMNKKQLEELMDLASKYEIDLKGIEDWSAEMASSKINYFNVQLKRGELKKRKQPYYTKEGLLNAFKRKYPETYNAIVNREKYSVEKRLSGKGNDKKVYNGKDSNHKRSHSEKNDIKESNKKSCNTCMLMKRGDCSGLQNKVCDDYKHSPSVSEREKENWPAYGDATAFKLGKRRF